MAMIAWFGVLIFVCEGTRASTPLRAVRGISSISERGDFKITSPVTTQRVTDVSVGLDALPSVRPLISPEDETSNGEPNIVIEEQNDVQDTSAVTNLNNYDKPEEKTTLDLNTNARTVGSFSSNNTNLTSGRIQTTWLLAETKNGAEVQNSEKQKHNEGQIANASDRGERQKGTANVFQQWTSNENKHDSETTTFKFGTIKTSMTQGKVKAQYNDEIFTYDDHDEQQVQLNSEATTLPVGSCDDCDALVFEDNLDDIVKTFTVKTTESRGLKTIVRRFHTDENDTLLFDDGPSAGINQLTFHVQENHQRSEAIAPIVAEDPLFEKNTPDAIVELPSEMSEKQKHEKLKVSAAANCTNCKDPLFEYNIKDVINKWAAEAKERSQPNNEINRTIVECNPCEPIVFNSFVNETEKNVDEMLEDRSLNQSVTDSNDWQFQLFENTTITLNYEETTPLSNNFSEFFLKNGNASFHVIFEGKEEEATEIIEEYIDIDEGQPDEAI